jgi:hypothetical protein
VSTTTVPEVTGQIALGNYIHIRNLH